MPDGESTPGKQTDDTITVGEHRFDPVAEPVRARRRRARPRPDDATVAPGAPAGRRTTDAPRAGVGDARPDGPDEREPEPADPADTRIVQFTRSLSAEDITRIRDRYGLALTAYVPNHAYVERVPAAVRRRLQRDPVVRALVPYLPEFKFAPSIADPDRRPPEGIDEGDDLLEAFLFDRGSIDRVAATVAALGGRDVLVLDDRPIGGNARVRFVVVAGTPLDDLADLDDVRWIEPVPRRKVDNVGATSVIQSGDATNASIWNKGLHGENQIIAMIDQGPLDMGHCFFDDVAPNTVGATHRKVLDLRNVSASLADSHATYVAGCAAGDQRGNSGAHANRGGAWAAKLVSGNFNDPNTLLAELNAARFSGAFIHTNSWHDPPTGGPGSPAVYNQTAHDVDNFTFINEEQLVLGSAGNTGNEQNPPGTAKNAVCVAASQGGANAMNFGSGNNGPTADGRRKPDLTAVGCGISSSTVNTPCGVDARGCATSWATPHTAAAAALVRQYLTEGWYPTGKKVAANAMTPTGALLKAILANATVDMTGVAGYPNVTEGWGLLRLDRALFFEGSSRRLTLWDVRHATGPTNGETRTHTVDVAESAEQLKVTLAFTDAPPAAGSFAAPTVNDLDLQVTAPDGTLYLGNAFTNGVSAPGGGADVGDSLNTIEQVLVNNPAKGRWTIEVRAFRVAVGGPGQGYGLVASASIKPKSGCFVATAVYGDPDHPDVESLRRWRDRRLEPDAAGRRAMAAFVAAYGVVGPVAARAVEGRPRAQAALRLALGTVARAVSPGRAGTG